MVEMENQQNNQPTSPRTLFNDINQIDTNYFTIHCGKQIAALIAFCPYVSPEQILLLVKYELERYLTDQCEQTKLYDRELALLEQHSKKDVN